MEKLPSFARPVKVKSSVAPDYEAWDRAVRAYDDKDYKRSIFETLKYINKNLLKGKNIRKDVSIKTSHGFVELEFFINDKEFKVYAKVAKIAPDTNKIALLRELVKKNFSSYDLVRLRLNKDLIELDYKSPLELCKPIKMYHIIKDIVHISEELSYIFIEKFGAKMVNESLKEELKAKELKRTLKQIELYLQEFAEFRDYFKENRLENYVWDITLITLYKISNLPNLNGAIKYEIYQEISKLYNGDIDFLERKESGEQFVNNLSVDGLKKSLYRVNFVASSLRNGDKDEVTEYISAYTENLAKMNADGSRLALAYYSNAILLRLLWVFDLDDTYKEHIYKSLENASRREVDKVDKELYSAIMDMYNQKVQAVNSWMFYIFYAWLTYMIVRGLSK